MEGCVLASMTEEEFRTRAPQGGDTLYAKLDIWRSAWNQRAAMAAAAAMGNMNKQSATPAAAAATSSISTTPSAIQIPTIQIDEACSDMSDMLTCWINNTQQDLQLQQQSSNCSSMLTINQQQHMQLAVPSPISTSSQRSALSPYSDHTHSGSEDFASEG